MKSKIFLTSIIALAFACPAFAVDGNALIENGDTCNVDNLGTSTNNDTANIEAIWTPTSIACNAGTYLDTTTALCTACPTNSYCPGGTFNVEMANTGNNLCSSLGDGSYTLTRSTNNPTSSMCYKTGTATCSTRNPYTGGHADSVVYGYSNNGTTGCKTFYSDSSTCVLDNAGACEITDLVCSNGYHKTATNVAGVPIINVDSSIDGTGGYAKGWAQFNEPYCWSTGYDSDDNTGGMGGGDCSDGSDYMYHDNLAVNEWRSNFSHGTVHGIASCNNTTNSSFIYINSHASDLLNGTITPEQFMTGFASVATPAEIELVQDALTKLLAGTLTIDQVGEIIYRNMGYVKDVNFDQTNTGKNCWCQMTGYEPTNSGVFSAVSAWLFAGEFDDSSTCADQCAAECSLDILRNAPMRSALFGTLGTNQLACVENTINLDWYNDTVANNGTKITPSNDTANQCTYSGTITVPTNTMQKAGYTFGGWKLRTNN